MWKLIAEIILKFRLSLVIIIGVITAFMGYHLQFIEISYDLASVVPEDDAEMINLQAFKTLFGEDGNIMAIGVQDSTLFELKNFNRFRALADELKDLQGVTAVLGIPTLQRLDADRVAKKFNITPLFGPVLEQQKSLDSLLKEALALKFYSGQLINQQTGATLLLVTLDKEIINSENRNELIFDLVRAGQHFEEVTGIQTHFAGLPYVRSSNMVTIKSELTRFLIYSIIITGIVLFMFFRSLKAVFFPLIVILTMVVWTLGCVSLFGFKITALTGLLPSIIVVIGIPNSVYMLNKYHHEYARHGDQIRALTSIIRKIGIVTLITNFTTAVGFFVLIVTDIKILAEFGIVAGLNIMATFVVSIILIPALYSYLKPPSSRNLKHLNFKFIAGFLSYLDFMVHQKRILIFLITITTIGISVIGVSKINSVSFMVDDLAKDSPLIQDLHFFEAQFSGIMPLEIIVDTGTKKGVQNLKNLQKIDEFEAFLDEIPYISQPVSLVSFIKAARQAFYNQNPNFYGLPNQRDLGFILKYLALQPDEAGFSQNFVDENKQKMRISLKVADIGSNKMDSLISEVIRPKIESLFTDTKMDLAVTGTTITFIKGNKFLIDNLISSMMVAFLVIAIIMGLLFRNTKMIIISLIPNLIPLLITGAIMGYFGIPLKPSTALVFSIAFGISVDDSIHFLAKYRQELFSNKFNVPLAISNSLKETGASMVYTSIILFCGFVIFSASGFGGTVALGKLTSITLLFAMITNLTVLPALLLQFDSGKRNTNKHPLIEQFPEFQEGKKDIK